jgi:hypothetical protein
MAVLEATLEHLDGDKVMRFDDGGILNTLGVKALVESVELRIV